MQLVTILYSLLACTASARIFTLYDEVNFGGNGHRETRNDDAACCESLTIERKQCSSLTNPREHERSR